MSAFGIQSTAPAAYLPPAPSYASRAKASEKEQLKAEEAPPKYETIVVTIPTIEEKPQNTDNSQVVNLEPARSTIETHSNSETLSMPDGWMLVAPGAMEFAPKRDASSISQYFSYHYLTEGLSKNFQTFKENLFAKKDQLAGLTNSYEKIEGSWIKNRYFPEFVSKSKEIADKAIPIFVAGKFAVEDAKAGKGSYEEITTIKSSLEQLLLRIKRFEQENPTPDYAVWDNKIFPMLLVGATLSGLLAAPVGISITLAGLAFTIKAATTILTKQEAVKTENIRKIRERYLEPLSYDLIERINEMPNPVSGAQPVTTQVFTEATAKTQDAVKKAETEAAQAKEEAKETRKELAEFKNLFIDFMQRQENSKAVVDGA